MAKRSRLAPKKIEQLVIIKDNNECLQEIFGENVNEDQEDDHDYVFKKIKIDVNGGQVEAGGELGWVWRMWT